MPPKSRDGQGGAPARRERPAARDESERAESGRMARTPSNNAQGRTTSMVPGRSVSLSTPGSSSTPQTGSGRMVFRPVIPPRRRVSGAQESTADTPPVPAPTDPAPAHARRPPPRHSGEMTASGPFALGPTEQQRRAPQRSAVERAPAGALPARADAKAPVSASAAGDGNGNGSEDDDGIEVVDIHRVHELDDMAPRALQRGTNESRIKKEEVKKEPEHDSNPPAEDVNYAQALDLSESEEEEDDDNLAQQFVSSMSMEDGENPMFLFQFPHAVPEFGATGGDSFAKETKDEIVIDEELSTAPSEAAAQEQSEGRKNPEGLIGRLDVYQNGRVLLKLGSTPFDITDGCETSFLQQVMVLDATDQTAQCLGELESKVVATPNLGYLLRQTHEG